MRDLQGTSLQIPKFGNLVQKVELDPRLCLETIKTEWDKNNKRVIPFIKENKVVHKKMFYIKILLLECR